MVFVSIMGTQIMAVLNPILVLENEGKRISVVHLLATPQTEQQQAAILKDILKDRGKSCVIHPISRTLLEVDQRPPAQELVSRLVTASEKEEIVFNLAGGMNFQVAACILALDDVPCFWVYPESNGVHLFRMEPAGIGSHEQYALPLPVDVLKYQGVTHRKLVLADSPFLRRFLPDYEGLGVESVQVEDTVFEVMANVGNELRFLKIIHSGRSSGKIGKDYLTEARDLISRAAGRDRFGELYHRSIGLLTNHPPVAEHTEKEALGKIRVFRFVPGRTKKRNLSKDLESFLFSPRKDYGEGPDATSIQTGSQKGKGVHLFVSLGTDIMTTLTALASHNPLSVSFVYTWEVAEVLKHVDALTKESGLFAAKTLSFIPVDFIGTEILDITPPRNGDIHVNITPGTKVQAAFLTKWAIKNGTAIFTIHTQENKVIRIDREGALTLKAPSPNIYLKWSGIPVLQYGSNVKSLTPEAKEGFDELLRFLRNLHSTKKQLLGFPYKRIQLRDLIYQPGRKMAKISKKQRGGKNRVIAEWETGAWASGELLEKLVGYRIAGCGAQDVQVRVRTEMSPEMEQHVHERYPEDYKNKRPHLTDLDVVARRDADYFLISCKAGRIDDWSDEQWEYTALEAAATSKIFGRFAFPLICAFRFEGDPDCRYGTVYRFGWKTLIDDTALRGVLDSAIYKKRT